MPLYHVTFKRIKRSTYKRNNSPFYGMPIINNILWFPMKIDSNYKTSYWVGDCYDPVERMTYNVYQKKSTTFASLNYREIFLNRVRNLFPEIGLYYFWNGNLWNRTNHENSNTNKSAKDPIKAILVGTGHIESKSKYWHFKWIYIFVNINK